MQKPLYIVGGQAVGFHKILATLDYSPLNKHVFAQAVELAEANHAKLLLFHSIATEALPQPMTLPGEMGLYPELTTNSYQEQQTQIEQQMHQVQTLLQSHCDLAQKRGISVESDYKSGDTGHLLCQAAEDWGADLIVLGRRGRTGLSEALLGSVSNYVLHHAPCSVLVIQAADLGTLDLPEAELAVSTDTTPASG